MKGKSRPGKFIPVKQVTFRNMREAGLHQRVRDGGGAGGGEADKCASSDSASCQVLLGIFRIIEGIKCELGYNDTEGKNAKEAQKEERERERDMVAEHFLLSGSQSDKGGIQTHTHTHTHISSRLQTCSQDVQQLGGVE